MAIGVVIGVAMGNVAVGIGAGAGIGIALMLAQSIRKQSNNPGKNEE
jgi:MFS superfamily sulfate permease-like transporter